MFMLLLLEMPHQGEKPPNKSGSFAGGLAGGNIIEKKSLFNAVLNLSGDIFISQSQFTSLEITLKSLIKD